MPTNSVIEGLKALTRLRAFSPNLFEISIFGGNSSESDDINIDGAFKTTLYCTAIDIPTPTLKMERHPLTRAYYVTGYNFIEDVTITWQEDQSLSVWNYHRDWIDKFYSRETDRYIVGPQGKKRLAIAALQKIDLGDEQKSLIPSLTDLHTLRFKGLIPKSMYPIKLSWDDDSSKSTGIQIRYSLDFLEYQFNENPTVKKTEWNWMSEDDWNNLTDTGRIL